MSLEEQIRQALHDEMLRRSITYTDIAKRLVRSDYEIFHLMCGKQRMTVAMAQALAEAIGCRWEARLHQRETAGEAVALVRDTPR